MKALYEHIYVFNSLFLALIYKIRLNGELIRENVMIVLLHVLIFIRSYIWNLLVNWTMKGQVGIV